jgi:hypothetical protein
MIFPIRIGKHEQDMGVCLITLCPHCQRVSPFKLREVGAAVLVFEQPVIGFGGDYRLICDSCKFQKDLDPGEFSAAKTAAQLYKQLETHEIEEKICGNSRRARLSNTARTARRSQELDVCSLQRESSRHTQCLLEMQLTPPRPGDRGCGAARSATANAV